jgi:hypothetical protein
MEGEMLRTTVLEAPPVIWRLMRAAAKLRILATTGHPAIPVTDWFIWGQSGSVK